MEMWLRIEAGARRGPRPQDGDTVRPAKVLGKVPQTISRDFATDTVRK